MAKQDVTSEKMTNNKATGGKTMGYTIRLRDEEGEQLKEKAMEAIVKTKVRIKESDVVHALIRKHLNQLSEKDILEYRREVLGKED